METLINSQDLSLRARMRAELPPDTFERQPQKGLWVIPLTGFIILGTLFLMLKQPPIWACILLALAIGQAYSMLAFLAHEALHGAIFQSKALQTAMGYLGFTIFMITPQLWRVWHNQIHHGQTNLGDRDPDSFGTLKRYERIPSTRFVTKLAPGSGHWFSYFFFGYWFTFHGQVVLWLQTKYMRSFEGFDRKPAIRDSLLGLIFWITLCALGGWRVTLFGVIIPMMVANAILMSYIATNHFLQPQSEKNEPLVNSMSVTTHPWIDRLHFNFGHHIEHHFFPSMNPKQAPRVRQWLQKNVGDQYLSPIHWKAILYLYRTPRLYQDANTLIDGETRQTVDLAEIRTALQK